jgi:hypothetical protein
MKIVSNQINLKIYHLCGAKLKHYTFADMSRTFNNLNIKDALRTSYIKPDDIAFIYKGYIRQTLPTSLV